MKKMIYLFIVGVFCWLLSACRASEDISAAANRNEEQTMEMTAAITETTVATETAAETSAVPTETQVQAAQLTASEEDTAWAFAYKDFLLEKYNESKRLVDSGEQDYMSYSTFALYYMDDDGIPEVMVTDSDSHVGTATILTIDHGKVVSFSGLGSFGVVYFREKENVIVGDYIGSGIHAIYVYHLDNGSLVTDWESKKQDTTGFEKDGKVEYSIFGSVVDEEKYQEQYDRFVPAWYDPMNSGIDACPEKEGALKGSAVMEPKEIEQFFAPWIAG